MQHGNVFAIGGGDEIDQRIAAVIVAAGSELLAGGTQHEELRIEHRVELLGIDIQDDSLAGFGGEAVKIDILAVGRAVDHRINLDDLGLVWLIVRLRFGNLGQSALHGQELRAAHAEPADEPHVVGARRHIGRGGNLEPALFAGDGFGGEAGLIEPQGGEAFQVPAVDLDFHAAARGEAERLEAVEADGGKLGERDRWR